MEEKPITIWLTILITAGVGVFILIWYGLMTIIDAASVGLGGVGMMAALVPIILGVLTLLAAFMIYSRSGKVFLTILLVLAIIVNIFVIVMLAALDSLIADFEELFEELGITAGSLGIGVYIEYIVQLVLAFVVFVLLYHPQSRDYFSGRAFLT